MVLSSWYSELNIAWVNAVGAYCHKSEYDDVVMTIIINNIIVFIS